MSNALSLGLAARLGLRRPAALRVACAVVLLALAACGGGGGTQSDDGGTPPSNTAPPPSLTAQPVDRVVVAGTSATFSVSADGATRYQWQWYDGAKWTDIPGATGASHTVPNVDAPLDGRQFRVVVANDGGEVTSAVITLSVRAPQTAPLITGHPLAVAVVAGQSAMLQVSAQGDSLAYGWQVSTDGGVSWLPVPGAMSATLDLPNLAVTDSGKRYRAVITNGGGTAESSPAIVTVTAAAVAPSIAAQPSDQAANPGQNVTFTVQATGTALAYQWQTSTDGSTFAGVPGSTTASLTLNGVALADSGRFYRVVVSNGVASVNSAAARLTVTAAAVAPRITLQPADQTVNEGQTASFKVEASGTTPTYQWSESTDAGATWLPIPSATAATLTVASVGVDRDNRRYRVAVTNSVSSVQSALARLTVRPSVKPPAITAQPTPLSKIVGQGASFSVAATVVGGTPAYLWESSPSGAPGTWAQINSSTTTTHNLPVVAIGDAGRHFRARVSNGVGDVVYSAAARLDVAWATVETSADTSQLETYAGGLGGGDDGGTPGGGDGAGTDGGGGLGKTVDALITVTRLADGQVIGRAATHPETGLVKIKAGPGTAPLLLTLSGNARARYFDEGRVAQGHPEAEAMLPFGDKEVLHALVERLDENLGVTPLTEAAYRYAINQFIVDPQLVANGKEPLRRTATAAELGRLTKEQIRKAHATILAEVNRKLPDVYRLESLQALPTPVDAKTPDSVLKATRYGRQQAVTGGLVAAAGAFNVDAKTPALLLTRQLADDLTDGVIDGYALDGKHVAAVARNQALMYDPLRLSVDLSIGAAQQAERFGKTTLFLDVPLITDVGELAADDNIGCPRWRDRASLLKDGRVRVSRTEYGRPKGKPPDCLPESTSTVVFERFATKVNQLISNGSQSFLLNGDGSVLGWGDGSCGKLGEANRGDVKEPVRIATLSRLTGVAAGTFAVAVRGSDGSVSAFGSDSAGELGLGDKARGLPVCTPASTQSPLPTAFTPQRIIDSGIHSVHVVRGRTFYALDENGGVLGWGSGQAMAFADGATQSRALPQRVGTGPGVTTIAGVIDATFALDLQGRVWAWGSNGSGGIGDGTLDAKTKPVELARLPARVVDLVGDGQGQLIALLDDGTVYGWGPRLGRLDAPRRPARIEGVAGVVAVRLGNAQDAVIYLRTKEGKVFKLDGRAAPFVPVDETDRFRD